MKKLADIILKGYTVSKDFPSFTKKSHFKNIDILKITFNKGAKILFKTLREQIGFSEIRYLVSGGAAPEWVGRGFKKFGFPIYQGYGLSETSPVVCVHRPNQKNKISSVGPPLFSGLR